MAAGPALPRRGLPLLRRAFASGRGVGLAARRGAGRLTAAARMPP